MIRIPVGLSVHARSFSSSAVSIFEKDRWRWILEEVRMRICPADRTSICRQLVGSALVIVKIDDDNVSLVSHVQELARIRSGGKRRASAARLVRYVSCRLLSESAYQPSDDAIGIGCPECSPVLCIGRAAKCMYC